MKLMRTLFFLLALIPCLAQAAVPSYNAFDAADFNTVPGQINVNGSIARLASPSFTGTVSAEAMVPNFAALVPYSLGNIAAAGTATLSPDYNYYTLTNTGSSYSIALPVGMPNCTVLIEATSTSSVDPCVVTLPNAAIRPESGTQTPITTFTILASSLAKYDVQLNIVGGVVERVHIAGDNFTEAITAGDVSFSPSAGLTSTDVQAALIELANKKADSTNLAAVATSGSYGDLTGTPPLATAVTVYASGTGYTLTATPSELDFSGTDPFIVISQAGSYLISGRATVEYVGATCTNQTVTLKFRRTNNTAADLANGSKALKLETTTTQTGVFVDSPLSSIGYTTANTDDRIAIYADVSSLPSPGSILVSAASLQILRISGWSVYDGSPPTVTSATIDTNGTSLTINHNETVTFGAGGNGGFAITPSGGAASLTYSSGSGSSALVYTLGRTIATNETATLAYTQPGSGVEDLSGNDLASFSGTNVVNNSTQSGFVPFTIGTDGGDYMTLSSAPAGFADAKTFTLSLWIDLSGADATAQDFVFNNANHFLLSRTTTNTFYVQAKTSGGTTILEAATSVTKVAADGWFHLFITVDLANSSNRHIYFNGTEDASVTWSIYTNNTIDLTTSLTRIGAGNGAANSIRASVCEFYFSNRYLNDTTKFRDGSNKPISLGATGNLPDGSAPGFYFSLSGGGSSWVNDSSGNGNTFTLTGAFSTPSPP